MPTGNNFGGSAAECDRIVTSRQLLQLFHFDRESENDILVARFCTERYGVKMYYEDSRVRVDGVSIADVLKILLLPPLGGGFHI